MAYNQPQNSRSGQTRQQGPQYSGGRSQEYSQFDGPRYAPSGYETQERWRENRDYREDEGYGAEDYDSDQDYELGGSEREWEHGGRENLMQRYRQQRGRDQQYAGARSPYGQGNPYNQNAWRQQPYRQTQASFNRPFDTGAGDWREEQWSGQRGNFRSGRPFSRDYGGGSQYFGGGQAGYGQGYNEDHFAGSGFGSRGNPWSEHGAYQPQGSHVPWQNQPSRHSPDYFEADYGGASGSVGRGMGGGYSGASRGLQGRGYSGFRGEGQHMDSQQQGYQSSFRGRAPKGYERSDERIREDVCECLTHDPLVDASEITVTVKSGVVTLEGSVNERQQKYRVEDLADNVSGVKDVQNRLTVERSESLGGSASRSSFAQGSGSMEGAGARGVASQSSGRYEGRSDSESGTQKPTRQ